MVECRWWARHPLPPPTGIWAEHRLVFRAFMYPSILVGRPMSNMQEPNLCSMASAFNHSAITRLKTTLIQAPFSSTLTLTKGQSSHTHSNVHDCWAREKRSTHWHKSSLFLRLQALVKIWYDKHTYLREVSEPQSLHHWDASDRFRHVG